MVCPDMELFSLEPYTQEAPRTRFDAVRSYEDTNQPAKPAHSMTQRDASSICIPCAVTRVNIQMAGSVLKRCISELNLGSEGLYGALCASESWGDSCSLNTDICMNKNEGI